MGVAGGSAGTDMVSDAAFPSTILVAEDEHLLADTLSQQLRKIGIAVVGPAPSGEHALALAHQHQPDFAVLDIELPEMTGLELAQALWEEIGTPSMLLSAHSHERYIEESSRLPIFGYLLKPLTAESLRAGVAAAWSSARRELSTRARVLELERTLEHRKVVERAKWRLVQDLGLNEPDAHLILQRLSRSSRAKIAQVAQTVVDAPDTRSLETQIRSVHDRVKPE